MDELVTIVCTAVVTCIVYRILNFVLDALKKSNRKK